MSHSIPAPATAAPSAGAHGDLPPAVVGFLDRLRRLPLGAWVEAGRRLEALDRDERAADGRGGTSSLGSVRARLRAVVERRPHVVARARQRVLDQASVAQGFVHPAELARMKKAALAAALALAARPSLGAECFAEVYEPFAALIPIALVGKRKHVGFFGARCANLLINALDFVALEFLSPQSARDEVDSGSPASWEWYTVPHPGAKRVLMNPENLADLVELIPWLEMRGSGHGSVMSGLPGSIGRADRPRPF